MSYNTQLGEVEVKVKPTTAEYRTAALVVSRRIGTLRSLPPVLLVVIALLIGGIWTAGWFKTQSVAIPVLIFALCAVLFVIFFIIEPYNIAKRAKTGFAFQQYLTENGKLFFGADEIVTVIDQPEFKAVEPYALMGECVELPAMFVIVRGRERMSVIPKRCLPGGHADEISEHLRHTFSRRYRKMRGWIF